MKYLALFMVILFITGCGDEPAKHKPDNNILLKTQAETEGKAVKAAGALLDSQNKQLKSIDGE